MIELEVPQQEENARAQDKKARSTSTRNTSMRDEPVTGIVIGRIFRLDESGAPFVYFVANGDCRLAKTRSIAAIAESDVGQEVALSFEGGDPNLPILLGLIHQSVPESEERNDRLIGGEKVTLSAENELVLSCGAASITLTKAGKILIRGAYVSSRSSGANRIRGGSVEIN